MEENKVEKKTFIIKSKWWTPELLRRLKKPIVKIGDTEWLEKEIKKLGWDKDG